VKTIKMSSANTFCTIERAANLAGISEQSLRNWLADEKLLPRTARPTYLLNGKTPLYSSSEIEALRRFVESR